MKISDLPPEAIINNYKLRISSDVEQLTDNPLTEGWFVSAHAKPGGWFMSPDPPRSARRTLIPTYGNPKSILDWEIIEEPKTEENESKSNP